MDGLTMFRVYNNSNHDVGITLSSNQQRVIRAGTFLKMSVDDILYIESNSSRAKPFSSKLFIVKDDNNNEYSLEELGGATDPYVKKHFDADEIAANLSKSAKHISSWLDSIDDPVDLDAIREIADKMDLPGSKLKVLQSKIPNRNLLDTEVE